MTMRPHKNFGRFARLLFVCLLVSMAITFIHRRWLPTSEERLSLHSQMPYQEVAVPFTLRNGLIYCQAIVNGKTVICIVDTGCPGILWPQRLHLSHQRTWLRGSMRDANDRTLSLTGYLFGSLKLGGYELDGVPSFAVSQKQSRSEIEPSVINQFLILGNSAFGHTVLTIDYQKKQLRVRQKEFDFSLPRQSPRSHVLSFGWLNPTLGNYGIPLVEGVVSGQPMRMIVDTGFTGAGIGLTGAAKNRAVSALRASVAGQVKMTSAVGTANVDYFKQVHWLLPDARGSGVPPLAMSTSAIVSPYLGADAICGASILQQFCVTIDYPRQKILLESR